LNELLWVFDNLDIGALIDIMLVGLLFFSLSFFIRGAQVLPMLRGVALVVISLVILARIFQLTALGWLFNLMLPLLAFAIPVIFQPELRRGLERLGRAGILVSNRQPAENQRARIIDEICQAAEKLSERRHGGLIVLQRNSNLDDYIRTGIPLDSDVSSQLLLTIFWPKTELHDGAAIIDQSGRIAAAAAVLPLSSSRNLPNRNLGTRHRAALGISEVSDAITIVVSEETGRISITDGSRMIPRLDAKRLQTNLSAIYGSSAKRPASSWEWVREQSSSIFNSLRDWRKQT
jgi:diadenylate cyclase